MPTGTKLEATGQVSKKIESVILTLPNIEGVSIAIGSEKDDETGEGVETLGSHEAQMVVRLYDKNEIARKDYLSSREVILILQDRLDSKNLQGANIEYILQESVFKAAFKQDKPINVLIRGNSLDTLALLAEKIKKDVEQIEGTTDVEDTLVEPQPEIKAEIIRDKVAFYNLSVNDIALASQVALKGNIASTFKEQGEEIDIRVRLSEYDRNDVAKIGTILFNSPLVNTIPKRLIAL